MSDLPRLRESGAPADRELLRAAEPIIPPGTQDRVRQAIERRLHECPDPEWAAPAWGKTRGAVRLRLSHVLLALLMGGSAVAIGASGLHTWLTIPKATPAAPDRPPGPELGPAPAPAPRPRPRKVVPPRPRAIESRAPASRPAIAQALPSEPVVGPPPELLRIARHDRKEIALQVRADRIEGLARGVQVSFVVADRELRGHIGDATVRLWLRGWRPVGDLIEGTIDGRDSAFYLRPTHRGQLLQGEIPGHSVRLELGAESLSFFPGCDGDLRATTSVGGATRYQGACGGRKTEVVLPAAFSRIPTAHQMVVLAVLLTETDPVFKYATPRLFLAD